MRIVGGALRGRRLAALGAGAPEAHLRPTPDRVREAVFNMLAHGPYPALDGARALDLFAGSGALGLEALSRGAAFALFVEDHPAARAVIRENVEALDLLGRTKIYRRDALRLGPHRGAPFDLAFLDPPYRRDLGPAALRAARAGGWLAAEAAGVLETARDEAEPDLRETGFAIQEQRVYGETRVLMLVPEDAAERVHGGKGEA